ncbi:MAG: SDR family NAD(P)-dependent oxidoreductase [Panacagrimonas sp.]
MPGNNSSIAIFGASGGLGHAVARRLAKSSPLMLGFCRNGDKADQLVREIKTGGGAAAAGQVDVRDPASVQSFLDAAARRGGRLTGVVSVTGPAIPLRALADVDVDDFRRILEADVIGSFNVLKACVPMLKASGGGPVVMFVTTAVLRILENDGMSSTPKMGVAGLVRLAAREAGAHNVRVNAIAPGVIDAGIVHSSFEADEVAKGVIRDCLAKTPLARMGLPEEIAATVEFLMSPGAAYISGQIIAVDGGYSA